ncbi:hypothetical protein GCM10022393_41850 [Aquimarina addita]|uniref:Uncharacterized protein n=1 Tax=Aquimarina addita TaxID=870485 RepID=A0ABP6UUH4_9FLAO
MRIVFSFLLLLTFALRPVTALAPFLYFQLNVDYIIENYCINKERPQLQCNGKCYLMNQLSEQNPLGETDGTIRISESFFPLYFQDTTVDTSISLLNNTSGIVQSSYSYLYSFLYSGEIDPPPKNS